MNNKGQGAFEYILLLAGILLIVVLVIVILKSSILSGASTNVNTTSNDIMNNVNASACNYSGSNGIVNCTAVH